MSLSHRLQTAQPHKTNSGCRTCAWWQTIRPGTQKLINEWIDNKHSVQQLYEIITTPSDDPHDPELHISLSGFRFHMAHHNKRCR